MNKTYLARIFETRESGFGCLVHDTDWVVLRAPNEEAAALHLIRENLGGHINLNTDHVGVQVMEVQSYPSVNLHYDLEPRLNPSLEYKI